MLARIAWDRNKDAANLRKHRVSFAQASEVFLDPLARTVADHRHDVAELRFFTVGATKSRKVLSVGHTDDGEEIRILTARSATLTERRHYEEF